jgi:hypothetical protein
MMRVVMHAQFPAMRARAHADSSRAKWALTLSVFWVAAACGTGLPNMDVAFTVSFVVRLKVSPSSAHWRR